MLIKQPDDLPSLGNLLKSRRSMQRSNVHSLVILGPVFWLFTTTLRAEDDGITFFESSVRPLLVDRCYECHSARAEKIKGGLQLDSKAGWMAGGDSGRVIVPGDADNSFFITAVRYGDPDLEMPPKGRLSEEEIATLEKWVQMGAPDPRTGGEVAHKNEGIDLEAGRQFWAFRPVTAPEIPAVKNTAWKSVV